MNEKLVNKSAILEEATYAICGPGKDYIKSAGDIENEKMIDVLLHIEKELLKKSILKDEEKTVLQKINLVKTAVEQDETLEGVTVLMSSIGIYKSPMDAVCFGDGGSVYVQYRGTPPKGWVQNPISYDAHIGNAMGSDGISSKIQEDGLDFFEQCAAAYAGYGFSGNLVVGGHSQGGNVAEYVMMMSDDYGKFVDLCVSFDAPNHSLALYEHIVGKQGEDYFKDQAKKIIAINGHNDYVNMQGYMDFAPRQWYITTDEAWARENGHGGPHGWHESLYNFDKEKGQLLLYKPEYIEGGDIELEFWGQFEVDRYEQFLKYLPIDKQLEFLEIFPLEQKAQIISQLPIYQQAQLLARYPVAQQKVLLAKLMGELPIGQQAQLLAYLPLEQQKWILDQLTAEQQQQLAEHQIPIGQQPQFSEPIDPWEQEQRARWAEAEMEKEKQHINDMRQETFGEQGAVGQMMTKMVEVMIAKLSLEQIDDCTKFIMALLESSFGSKKWMDALNAGLDLKDVTGFIVHGLPMIFGTLMFDPSVLDQVLDELIGVENKGNIQGIAATLAPILPFVALPAFFAVLGVGFLVVAAASLAGFVSLQVHLTLHAIQLALDGVDALVQDVVKSIVNMIDEYYDKELEKAYKKQLSAGIAYASTRPYIRVDTDKLRIYGVKISIVKGSLQEQISALIRFAMLPHETEEDEAGAARCITLAESLKIKLDTLENIWTFLYGSAERFEDVEAKLCALLKE